MMSVSFHISESLTLMRSCWWGRKYRLSEKDRVGKDITGYKHHLFVWDWIEMLRWLSSDTLWFQSCVLPRHWCSIILLASMKECDNENSQK